MRFEHVKYEIPRDVFDKVWREISKQYQTVGSVLDMLAIMALFDAYDVVEETPLFKHNVKGWLNRSYKEAKRYEKVVRECYGEQFSLWADYNSVMQEQLEGKVFVVYNSVYMFLSKKKVVNLVESAKCLTALVLLSNAKEFHDDFFKTIDRRTQIKKFRELFDYAKMDNLCANMQNVCKALTRFGNNDIDDFGKDLNIALALAAINNHLSVEDNLNNAAKTACSMDLENYGDTLAELDAQETARIAVEREKKAVAEQVAIQMKKDAENAKKEAMIERLSSKYKVKTPKQ